MKMNQAQHETEDRRLIEHYRRTRSAGVFETIVDRLESLLMNHAMKHQFAHRAEALDAVQDAFLWLFEHIDALDAGETILNQLCRVVRSSLRRNAIYPKRFKSRFTFFEDHGDNRSDTVPFEETLYETGRSRHTPAKASRRKTKAVRKALEELPPRLREAAESFFCWNWTELSRAQLARESGDGYSYLNQRINTAVSRLEKNPELRRLVGLESVPAPPKRQDGRGPGLTERQTEVVRLIHEQGVSFRETSKRLGLYPHTVRYNWKAALKKIAASRELQTLTGIGPGMYGI